MKNKNKILPRVIIIVLVITLISTLVLASVYAKYVSKDDPDAVTARPAAFELVMNTASEDSMEFNFAADGEPGAPIGYTEAEREFDFSVVTSGSEVSSKYILAINFNNKLTKMIYQARDDRFKDGIWCDFEVYQCNSEGKYEKIDIGEETGLGNEDTSKLTWELKTELAPNTNPDGTTSGETKYRLKMIVYNNTMMPDNGNTLKYVFSSDAIDISVTSTQLNPNFEGNYVGK